ncbi:unnamed protein product [Caenorhabditis brenneri]
MKKYAALVKKGNTPFESVDRKIQSIRRLWTFLVRKDHLREIFIKYIFSQHSIMENAPEPVDAFLGIDNNPNLPEAYKIVQKDNESIVAFGCNQESPGLIVVSNGIKLQEMDMSNIFRDQYDQTSWMWNRTDLDMKSIHNKRDALRDNDDYQIFTDSSSQTVKHTNVMIKRHIPGVRRIDSHSHAPFYVAGATDGSIKVWKWGAKDTVYTARVAGQHAKVSKIAFSCNGNKFSAVYGDGMLGSTIISGGRHGEICLWDIRQRQLRQTIKAFDQMHIVKTLATDSTQDLIVSGSSEGDIKIWSADSTPQLMYNLPGEYTAKGEFSFRKGEGWSIVSPRCPTTLRRPKHATILVWCRCFTQVPHIAFHISRRRLVTNQDCIGEEAKKTEPLIRQVFVSADYAESDPVKFERSVYLLSKQAVSSMTKQEVECYVCSLSTSTVVYKGQFNSHQLFKYYDDLTNPENQTHLALVHSRCSANTFPRTHQFGCLDNVMEFLVRAGGKSLPVAAMTMVLEEWEKGKEMYTENKDFYRWAAFLPLGCMEPLKGPVLLVLSDGKYIGSILDRNGLRPARYYLTEDDHPYLTSEVGVDDTPIEPVVEKVRFYHEQKRFFIMSRRENEKRLVMTLGIIPYVPCVE